MRQFHQRDVVSLKKRRVEGWKVRKVEGRKGGIEKRVNGRKGKGWKGGKVVDIAFDKIRYVKFLLIL